MGCRCTFGQCESMVKNFLTLQLSPFFPTSAMLCAQEREEAATAEHAAVDAFAWGSVVEGGPLDIESEYDRRLSVGASIACRLRGAVHEKLGALTTPWR